MIESEYYQNYKGPPMTRCILDDKDITEIIQPIYGPENNWGGYLWTYKELFGTNKKGSTFRFDFIDRTDRNHWFYGWIDDENQYCNFPLATPISQNI